MELANSPEITLFRGKSPFCSAHKIFKIKKRLGLTLEKIYAEVDSPDKVMGWWDLHHMTTHVSIDIPLLRRIIWGGPDRDHYAHGLLLD